MLQILTAYLVIAMTAWVPAENHAWYQTPEQTAGHYQDIASDIVEVAMDPDEIPVFDGPDGRAETALLLASIASWESAFNQRTDEGKSIRKGDNDGGKAVGIWQTHWRGNPFGWSRSDIANDRKKAARLALFRIRESFGACRNFPLESRLTVYATGQACRPTEVSKQRVSRALRWWKAHPFTENHFSE